jgi:formate dehydrogenase maturation protein FdhE
METPYTIQELQDKITVLKLEEDRRKLCDTLSICPICNSPRVIEMRKIQERSGYIKFLWGLIEYTKPVEHSRYVEVCPTNEKHHYKVLPTYYFEY